MSAIPTAWKPRSATSSAVAPSRRSRVRCPRAVLAVALVLLSGSLRKLRSVD